MPRPSEPPLTAAFRKCALGASAFCVLISCGVVLGWIFDLERLKRILPGLVAMNPLTAIDFILCGFALAILRRETLTPGIRLLARAAAAIVVLTAFLKLAGILFGFDLRLDQVLFREMLDLDPVHINRMAPNTALNFLLLGSAFLLADVEGRRSGGAAQLLALCVGVVGSLAFIGYLYGVKALTGVASYKPMALHSALIFVAVAGGLLCAQPDRGWMARVTSSNAGGVMIRRMAIVVVGAPLVLGWLILSGERSAFYNSEFAFSLVIISVILVFSAVVWVNAQSLNLKEAESRRASEQLRRAHDELEAQIVERTAELSQALMEIGKGIEVLGASAKEILDSTTDLAADAANTATALTETTTTIEQVRQTARLSNEKAQHVVVAARSGADISSAGRKATEDMRAGMERIREQMQLIAESMARLAGQTDAIAEILAAVEEIAAQSKLLAVNAAIEAAKAGQYGKGFAVVAEEVKSLADQSKASTTQVRKILGEIQNAASAATARTGQGADAVEAGVVQSGEAGNAILALADSAAQSALSAAEIAVSCEQELMGMDQVVSAMSNIKKATTRNRDSARHLEAAARVLNELGEKLKAFAERRRTIQ